MCVNLITLYALKIKRIIHVMRDHPFLILLLRSIAIYLYLEYIILHSKVTEQFKSLMSETVSSKCLKYQFYNNLKIPA